MHTAFALRDAGYRSIMVNCNPETVSTDYDRPYFEPVAEADKPDVLEAVGELARLGFRIKATHGTRDFLASKGIPAELVLKLHEGRPNLVDAIKNGAVDLLVNPPSGKESAHDDSYIRKAAIRARVPYVTTAAAALMTAKGIAARRAGAEGVRSLQDHHASIR